MATARQHISLPEAVHLLPAPVSGQTLLRWVKQGVGGVRLGAVKVGGRWVTTQEDVSAFVRMTTCRAIPSRERTPTQRDTAAEAAMERMRRKYKLGTRHAKEKTGKVLDLHREG
jgi:hypothetical protein